MEDILRISFFHDTMWTNKISAEILFISTFSSSWKVFYLYSMFSWTNADCTLSGWCRLLKWSRTIGKLFINNEKKFQVKALLHFTLFNTAVSFIAQCLALVARVLVVALSLLKYWMCTPIRRDQMRSKLPRCNAQTFYRSYNNVLVIARGM